METAEADDTGAEAAATLESALAAGVVMSSDPAPVLLAERPLSIDGTNPDFFFEDVFDVFDLFCSGFMLAVLSVVPGFG